ncbi:MAG: hypothetical protein J5826_04705 [Bacteroidales bacterium]|nr:hypothetical protein [Bacteroidales bacterium]
MEASVQLPEAAPYWELIKNASNNIKLALISMLSESIRIGTKTPPQKTALQLSPAEIREQKAKELWKKEKKINKSELVISPEILSVIKEVPEMDKNVDYDKIKYDYLMEKYG